MDIPNAQKWLDETGSFLDDFGDAQTGLAKAAEVVESLLAEIERLRAIVDKLPKQIDIAGWDDWFFRLQLAVRGNESLINECGERIRKAAKAAKEE